MGSFKKKKKNQYVFIWTSPTTYRDYQNSYMVQNVHLVQSLGCRNLQFPQFWRPDAISYQRQALVFQISLVSMHGQSSLSPEGFPNLEYGLGSKLLENLICTTQYTVLEEEVWPWNRCGLKLENNKIIAGQKCGRTPSKTSIMSWDVLKLHGINSGVLLKGYPCHICKCFFPSVL